MMMSPGARRVLQAAMDEELSVADLGEVANSDPAFALRVLAVANSAAYIRAGEVTNVEQACALLGNRGLRNIALGMLVADLVPAAEGAASLLSNCLRRAIAAKHLAVASKLVLPEDGFFAGLLLEVGLLQQACDLFDECIDVSQSPARHRATRERAAGLKPHPAWGASLAEQLLLPRSVIQAIEQHHDPHKPAAPLSALCWAAESAAAVLEAGDESQNLRVAEAAAAQIGVGTDDLRALLEAIPDEVKEISRALECPAGPPQSERGIRRPAERDLGEMHRHYEEAMAVLERVLEERDKLIVELAGERRAS